MARASRRLALGALLGCVVATACGGQSVQRGGDGGGNEAGAGSGGGGTGPGGKGGKGGTTPKGGAPTGGFGGDGGFGAVSGTIGSGGTVVGGTGGSGGTAGAAGEPGFCFLSPDTGPCDAAMRRYAFDGSTGLCVPFTYGGCDGNDNNFETVESCYAACGGQGAFDPALCMTSLECALFPVRCCGACEEATLWSRVAIIPGRASMVQDVLGCDAVDCPPCDPPSPNPWLGAACRQRHCAAFDLQETELTLCNEPADCVLRGGVKCCESCAPSLDQWVAVNRTANTSPLLCGDDILECDACAPAQPPGLSATCTGGRCQLAWLD